MRTTQMNTSDELLRLKFSKQVIFQTNFYALVELLWDEWKKYSICSVIVGVFVVFASTECKCVYMLQLT